VRSLSRASALGPLSSLSSTDHLFRYISDVTSGTTEKSPGFPTFTHAFVWALAGGNPGLANIGLLDRWGWVPPSKRNTVGGSSAPSTPNRLSLRPPAGSPPASVQGPSASTTTPSRIRWVPSLAATSTSPSVLRSVGRAPPSLASQQSPLRETPAEDSDSGSEVSNSRGQSIISPSTADL
jgi:hypothetical protein